MIKLESTVFFVSPVFLNLEPLFGTLLGVSLLHEQLRSSAILGGVLIIGPAIYFSRKPR